MCAQKLICGSCKDEVLRVIEEHLQSTQAEITKLSFSSSGEDLLKTLSTQILLAGAKSVKYKVGNMWVNKNK